MKVFAAVVAVGALAVSVAGIASAGPNFSSWAPAGPVAEVNTVSSDGCPIQSPDGLSLYLASTRTGGHGGLDIWVARRASGNDPWGAPMNLGSPINSTADDFCPTPIRGGGLFFVSRKTVPGVTCGLGDIYFARLNPSHGWSEPEHLNCAPEGPNSELDEMGPSYVEASDPARLYFSSSRAAGQVPGLPAVPGDIFVSRWGPEGSFGEATLVAELNSAANDIQPNVRKDGREVVLSSNRTGTVGSQDIWVATRESAADPWSAPVNLGAAVNTADSETRPSLSWDGLTLYFGRAPAAGGPGDIYNATREKTSRGGDRRASPGMG